MVVLTPIERETLQVFCRDNVLYFVVMEGPTHRNVTSQQDRRKEKK